MIKSIQEFTPTSGSDNRFKFLNRCIDLTDEIIIGGSCIHMFEFPFVYSDYAKSGTIYYKQGSNMILEIAIDPYSMVVQDRTLGKSLITVKLTPLQTQNFERTNLDTFTQLRFVTVNDNVEYSDLRKVIVIEPIKVEEVVGKEGE